MTDTPVCEKGCLLERINLAGISVYSSYRPGELINSRGSFFIICRGPVGYVWGTEEKSCLEILGPGDIWEGWEYTAGECQAWALGEVSGHWVEQAQWLELLRNPIVEDRFVCYNHRRLQRLHEWQLILARGSVRARVAWQLTDLAQRFGERDARTGEIFVPIHLTQVQQAQLCGSVRSQVWEALREFEGKRWVICSPQGFWVRDAEALLRQSREGL